MNEHRGKKWMCMGGELGQGREWNYDRSLDWHLLEKPLHAGLKRFVADLNHVYTSEPALHEVDTKPSGFLWIDFNDTHNPLLPLIPPPPNPAHSPLSPSH